MKTVIIKLAPPKVHRLLMTVPNVTEIAGLLHEQFEKIVVRCDLEGEDAAEDMFDLTNNPSRQEERQQKYGCRRSLSVGDVVQVGNDNYVCGEYGWVKLYATS